MDRYPTATNAAYEGMNMIARRHPIPRRADTDSRPELMLGIMLLGTSFAAGLFIGWIIA